MVVGGHLYNQVDGDWWAPLSSHTQNGLDIESTFFSSVYTVQVQYKQSAHNIVLNFKCETNKIQKWTLVNCKAFNLKQFKQELRDNNLDIEPVICEKFKTDYFNKIKKYNFERYK